MCVCVCTQLRGVLFCVCLTLGVWAGNAPLETVMMCVCGCVCLSSADHVSRVFDFTVYLPI